MPWYKQEQPTSFDQEPIDGLYFLHGDVFATALGLSMFKGQKFPEIEFPSGESFTVFEGHNTPIIHLFGEADLALYDKFEVAFAHACDIAEQCGYLVRKVGDKQFEIIGRDDGEFFRLTYDDTLGKIVDVQKVQEPQPEVQHPAHNLLPDDIRAKLPKLYETDGQGMDAQALVKYFLPGTQWTWYATEFDGKETFFGLVVGFEAELGYFTLTDLQDARGAFDLPMERDLYFDPTTLGELKRQHEQ